MIVSQFLVRHRDGFSLFYRAAAVTAWGTREAYLSLGQMSKAQAKAHVEALFDERTAPTVAYRAGVFPRGADIPLVDAKLGDTLTTPGGELRMLAVTVTQDQNNALLRFTPEINAVKKRPIDRVTASIASMSKGTVGGTVLSASPASPAAPVGRSRGPGAGVGGRMGILIAASNSAERDKAGADYLCDGTNDSAQWTAALADAAVSNPHPPKIFVAPGIYNFSATVTVVAQGQVIEGLGGTIASAGPAPSIGVTIRPKAGSPPAGPLLIMGNETAVIGINFLDFGSGATDEQLRGGTARSLVERCSFTYTGFGGFGTHYSLRHRADTVRNCHFDAPVFENGDIIDGRVMDCTFVGCGLINPGGGASFSRLISGNIFLNGTIVGDLGKALITGNTFSGGTNLIHALASGAGSARILGNAFNAAAAAVAVLIDAGANAINVGGNDMLGLVITDNSATSVQVPANRFV